MHLPVSHRLLVPLAAVLLMASGCLPHRLLSDVGTSKTVISPNGDGVDDKALIHYALSDDARVSVYFDDAAGRRDWVHQNVARTPGDYSAQFDGTYYEDQARHERRVMPDGLYTFHVQAADARGVQQDLSGQLTIQNADTQIPQITDLAASYDTISPNGDAEQDETIVNYTLTKKAEVTVYALDEHQSKYILDPPKERTSALYSYDWNGTFGDRILPDGKYEIHIQAADKSGNSTDAVKVITVENGGIARLEITKVDFSPKALPVGGTLNVKIKVQNTGDVPLKTLGPPPGTAYETTFNFLHWTREESDGSQTALYYERAGVWRVGVNWSQADRPYPARWALTADDTPLLPGQEATITGTIKVMISQVRELQFWAGVEQGGVGFPGGQKGLQTIVVSY